MAPAWFTTIARGLLDRLGIDRERRLALRNRFSRRHVTGAGPVVSLTTHGDRADRVHLTIETIGQGFLRPAQLVLWVDDERLLADLSPALRRLQRRGLTVRLSPNYGPHTKYYPYVTGIEGAHTDPLVTADDDILYPVDWLQTLAAAHERAPELIHCFRARRIQLAEGALQPYSRWPPANSTNPSLLNFATGVSGVIYPPRMLDELRARGTEFLERCPRADDVWLHHTALRLGIRTSQVAPEDQHFDAVSGTQDSGLMHGNLYAGANDSQIAATYTAGDVAVLARLPIDD